MATDDIVGIVTHATPTGADAAEPGIRQSASSPAENFPVLRFDDTTTEYYDLHCSCEGYDGSSGVKIRIPWTFVSGMTSNVTWGAGVRDMADDDAGSDMDLSHTYSYQTVSAAPPSAAGELAYDEITLSHAQFDSVANKNCFVLRLRRSDANGEGDAEIYWANVVIRSQ